MKKSLQSFPLYAFLLPLIIVLILVANNLGQMQLSVAWRPLWISFLLAVGVFMIGWAVFRSTARAGQLAFIISFFALTFGHFYEVMEGRVIGTWVVGHPAHHGNPLGAAFSPWRFT